MILFYGIYFNFKQKIMIKKLLLLTIIFFWFFLNGNVFADENPSFNIDVNIPAPSVPEIDFWDNDIIVPEVPIENSNYSPWDKYDNTAEWTEIDDNIETSKKVISDINKNISEIEAEMDWLDKNSDEYKKLSTELNAEKEDLKNEKAHLDKQIQAAVDKRKADCKASKDCIDQASFTIETWKIFGGISSSKSSWDTNTGTNILLGTIIQKLMVALGILSVLIMTVGGWYIILYHGQDELLSKGKSIFMSWIIALVIALSSYMIVGLLRFILYN